MPNIMTSAWRHIVEDVIKTYIKIYNNALYRVVNMQ